MKWRIWITVTHHFPQSASKLHGSTTPTKQKQAWHSAVELFWQSSPSHHWSFSELTAVERYLKIAAGHPGVCPSMFKFLPWFWIKNFHNHFPWSLTFIATRAWENESKQTYCRTAKKKSLRAEIFYDADKSSWKSDVSSKVLSTFLWMKHTCMDIMTVH